jgi:hypothetical protein
MKVGAIIVQRLTKVNAIDVWEIEEFHMGGIGEISVVEIKCLTRKNSIDDTNYRCFVPILFLDEMVNRSLVELYEQRTPPLPSTL